MRGIRGLSGAVIAVIAGPAAAQTPLPMIYVDAPSPIVRRAPGPGVTVPSVTVTPQPQLQGTLPVVTDQFATVTVLPRDEIQRTHRRHLGDLLFDKPGITGSTFAPGGASRPVVRGLDNYRVRIQENGLAVNDVSDLGEDHARADRSAGGAADRGDPRAGDLALGIAGDRRRRQRREQPDPDRAAAARPSPAKSSARSRSTAASKARMLLDAGAGNVAVHADVLRPQRATTTAFPAIRICSRPTPRRWSTAASRIPPRAGRLVGRRLVHFRQRLRRRLGDAFRQLLSHPRRRGDGDQHAHRPAADQVHQQGRVPPASRPDRRRSASGSASATTSTTSWRTRGGFDGVQQTFTNKAQEGRFEVQLAPFDLRFAALTTALGVQAARQQLAAPGRRRRPVRSEPR